MTTHAEDRKFTPDDIAALVDAIGDVLSLGIQTVPVDRSVVLKGNHNAPVHVRLQTNEDGHNELKVSYPAGSLNRGEKNHIHATLVGVTHHAFGEQAWSSPLHFGVETPVLKNFHDPETHTDNVRLLFKADPLQVQDKIKRGLEAIKQEAYEVPQRRVIVEDLRKRSLLKADAIAVE